MGVIYGIAAYSWWGIVPIYFKTLAKHGVEGLDVLTNRVAWSLLILLGLVWATGRGARLREALTTRRSFLMLLATAVLIALNWYAFIVAVETGRVLQSSLGYYINPLVNVLFGYIFLKERLSRQQVIAVAFAACGVLFLIHGVGEIPIISLFLATTFGGYGLLRKMVGVDSMTGLAVETILLSPLAFGWLAYRGMSGTHAWPSADHVTNILLPLAGFITTIPLIWFASAARRLRLGTIGIIQYISPTLQFVLAVMVYQEAFTMTHKIAFGFIWTAVAIYTTDALWRSR